MRLIDIEKPVSNPQENRAAGIEPLLLLSRVTKSYTSAERIGPAVHNVTLGIQAGDVTALMGPSGSGKTTLLSIMGGILQPSTGNVRLCGREIGQLTELERGRIRLEHIGFVFQSYNLFPALTARQNIEVVLDLKHHLSRHARRDEALRLLDNLGLVHKADAYPAALSGGQKQRVAIARALAGDPGILLADEPTAALDWNNGRNIMSLFQELARRENRAVVIVTHDTRILDFADRVVTIEDGAITADSYSRPQKPMRLVSSKPGSSAASLNVVLS